MRCKSLVLVLTAGLGGVAVAQPGPPPAPPPDTTTTSDPAPPDTTPPPPPPRPAPAPVVVETPTDSSRPEGMSFALGLGYALPTSLETPNVTSARMRLGGGLTFEPRLAVSNTTEETDTPTMESKDKNTSFGLATLVRFPLITRNRVDLEVLGSAGFTTEKDNPDGDYNTRTTNTFGIGWGLGIAYWFSQHWQLSMSVTNPLIAFSSTKQQTGPGGMATKNTDTLIGVIFDPDVVLMIHLYN